MIPEVGPSFEFGFVEDDEEEEEEGPSCLERIDS